MFSGYIKVLLYPPEKRFSRNLEPARAVPGAAA
jgi:hypothetical protein